jgi:diadenosine tetraphosphate (Ap4A) HIT family hydrolase
MQKQEDAMPAPCKFEISILKHDEQEIIRDTHHPAIGDMSRDKLESIRSRLRDIHGKERTLARHRQRETKGKAESRGSSFSGTAEHATQRKQVFVAAIKRVNKELKRIQKFEAKKELGEAARRALALRRAQQFARMPNDPSPHEGMHSIPNRRRKMRVPPSKIGSVSQANKRAQAGRDANR